MHRGDLNYLSVGLETYNTKNSEICPIICSKKVKIALMSFRNIEMSKRKS